MKLPIIISIYILTFLSLSCKKKELPKSITAGFSTNNKTSIIQGTKDTQYVNISLSAVADRDIYIKYNVSDGNLNSFKLLDNSYFVIKKGEQSRSIPFILIDHQQTYDIPIKFYIYKVYDAEVDNQTKSFTFTVKTNYIPTSGNGSVNLNRTSYKADIVTSGYRFENFNYPIGDRYGVGMNFASNRYLMSFTFYKFPQLNQTYPITFQGPISNTDNSIISSLTDANNNYNSYKGQSGFVTITQIDTVNKSMSLNFYCIYYNNDTVQGNINFSRYNFLK